MVMKKCSALTGFPPSSPLLSKSAHPPNPLWGEAWAPTFYSSCALWFRTVLCYLRDPRKSVQGLPCSHLLNPLLPPLSSFRGATCFSLGPFYLTSHSCDRQSTELVGLVLHFIAFLPPTSSLLWTPKEPFFLHMQELKPSHCPSASTPDSYIFTGRIHIWMQ